MPKKVLDMLTETNRFIALNAGIDTTKRKDPMAIAIIHLFEIL